MINNLNSTSYISQKLNLPLNQVNSTLKLLDEGGTVPFIARYRKEATGSLDETVILNIKSLNEQFLEFNKRKASILKSLEERDLLTSDLDNKIGKIDNLTELEDLYLPYRPKKRTRATIATENGLEPLAKIIFNQPFIDIYKKAKEYLNPKKEVNSIEEALGGAQDIIAEWISEDSNTRKQIRTLFERNGVISSKVVKTKIDEGQKFKDYFDFQQNISRIPGHRLLAIFRGKNQGVLTFNIRPDEEEAIYSLKKYFVSNESESAKIITETVKDSYKRLVLPSIENEFIKELKIKADEEAINIFADNLRELLMQSPLGRKNIIALDPGFRTGAKLVCLDSSGSLLHFETVFPVGSSQSSSDKAAEKIKLLCSKYKTDAIAIGNGTAGRETESFVRSLNLPDNIIIKMVNESGASIYSASDTAREEFPDLDLTYRGSVSIARRLMDPLAELVKIDPKSIGVGQYQHDVDQTKLKDSLTVIVESCVNNVGVELNTASKELLSYVSGIGPVLAKNIINYRTANGPFKSRSELKKVKRLGPNAFLQSAGFLRIHNAKNPLDSSAVHPESYQIVKKMATESNCTVIDLISSEQLRKSINIQKYVDNKFGLPTLNDIIEELAKPGRDPRKEFEVFNFAEGINSIEDLIQGMELPGIITNVTKFGAFVDIGVHQDGLVHISQLSNSFVSNPADIVKVNQTVSVKVIEIDVPRKRISLSMKK
jgi:protein Tex